MRPITNIVGIILVIFGIAILAYRGYNYTTEEKVAQIGDVQITSEEEKRVNIPPIIGGLALVAGIVLVVVARRR